MISLFTTPRPFTGLYTIIQDNAFRSWCKLDPKPERVVIFADEQYEGTEPFFLAGNLGFQVEPVPRRSVLGVPLLPDLFARGQEIAAESGSIPCYVNADIILESDLVPGIMATVEAVKARAAEKNWRHNTKHDGVDPASCLLLARRWNVQMLDYMDLSAGWEARLKEKVDLQGSLMDECAMDLFAWYGTVWGTIPDFAIGRYRWDNWLAGEARVRFVPTIDVSQVIRLTHQSHAIVPWGDPDSKTNQSIGGSFCGLKDSTHTMTKDGLKEGWLG